MNALANALPLNGANTGVLSDEIPNLFVPAGLTFSVWGLIYLLLTCYVVAAVREAWGKNGAEGRSGAEAPSAWTGRDATLFIANMAANVAWIFAWHWRLVGLAMVLMLVILGTLIALEQGSQRKIARGGILDERAGAAPLDRRRDLGLCGDSPEAHPGRCRLFGSRVDRRGNLGTRYSVLLRPRAARDIRGSPLKI